IQIFDRYGQLVPIGVPGEIHIGGVQLARGYLHRPELTKERFVPNPFAASEKLYKTGDLGRYLRDGRIECLGRLDNQVKIRGFRIELGEIEANLILHPEIKHCVVTAREDIPGDKRLVAYVIGQSTFKTEELRAFLQQKLPYYMIPSHFVLLERFPLTPNGKIDLKALPTPYLKLEISTNNYLAPQNLLQQKLIQIWEKVLEVQPISINDNFFDLGGHSLLTIYLLEQIQQQFNKQVSLEKFFQAPTIKQISEYISQPATSKKDSEANLITMRIGGDLTPIFFVAPGSSTVMQYHNLVKYLPQQHPCYCFSLSEIDNLKTSINTTEEIAAFYIQQMKNVNFSECILVSRCTIGAIIIYEMALQLQSKGKFIKQLLMLDPSDIAFANLKSTIQKTNNFKNFNFFKKIRLKNRFNRLIHYYQKRELIKVVLSKVIKHKNYQYSVEEGTEIEKIQKSNLSENKKRELISLFEQQKEAILKYKPNLQEIYHGEIVLFLNEFQKISATGLSRYEYWQELVTQDLQINLILGNHKTMLREPDVKDLGEKMKLVLENSDR
ncbi:MAG: phosphopantetheine-binding protein, partial [Waterburya sp.]